MNMDESSVKIKPEEEDEPASSLPRTIMSLLFFVGLYYWLFHSWTVVLALIVVLLIHEAGHFIAMKAMGYKAVNITFVPFAGAYVSGETGNFSNRNKLIVLLAGPLPGIIIGMILLWQYHYNDHEVLYWSSVIFLLQNTFNLLPVLPLDGGQFFQALFFNINGKVQLIFLYLLLAFILFASLYWDQNWGWLVFTIPLAFKIWRLHFVTKVRARLDKTGIDYTCNYDDLTDEEYQHIRNEVITQSSKLSSRFKVNETDINEHELIPYVERVLIKPYDDTLTVFEKILFVLIWAAAVIAPLLLWAWHTGKL